MKKIFAVVLTLAMVFSLPACGNSSSWESNSLKDVASTVYSQTESSSSNLFDTETEASSNELIVYFTWSGNTEALAKEIHTQTGADVFEITPVEPYTDDYDALLDIAQEEKASDARPAIAEAVENFAQYDVIYFGYPNWWGDMPMILYTFLDDYDFSSKIIAPFVTSGGSGFSSTINEIKSLEPDAVVVDGLSIGSSKAVNSRDEVTEWLSSIELAE